MKEAEVIRSVWTAFRATIPSPTAKLYLFGSRADGSNSPYSDFDFFVKDDGITAKSLSALMPRLSEKIEEIPTLFKIDIMGWDDLSDDFRVTAMRSAIEVKDGKI